MLTDYINIVSTLATIVTILQFLSGTDICRKIIKQRSIGDISGFPFVVGTFSTSIWLFYSYLIQDFPMGLTNTVGVVLQVVYLLVYIRYCTTFQSLKTIGKQISIFIAASLGIVFYVFSNREYETVIKNVGLLCCLASISFSMSPLVSIREVFKTKSTSILPFPLLLSMFFVGGLWCLYGLMIGNSYVAIPNLFVFVIAGFQLLLFLVFPSNLKEYTEHLI